MPPLNAIRIDRNGSHFYTLDHKHVDGVSTILKKAIPFANLRWAAGEVAEYAADNLHIINDLKHRDEIVDLLRGAPFRTRDRAAKRGGEVHRLAHKMADGLDVEV